MNQSFAPIKILLVEDNPGDIRLTKEALRDGKINNTLDVVEDGLEAIDFLNKKGKFKKANRPDLILLDLDLPNMSGREVLKLVKKDEPLRSIPIAILTVSQADQEILKSYDMQANVFVTKPVDFDQFVHIIRSIEDLWFTIVKLPRR
jgi:chemotaxis family two-component system response regulator Rcp1